MKHFSAFFLVAWVAQHEEPLGVYASESATHISGGGMAGAIEVVP